MNANTTPTTTETGTTSEVKDDGGLLLTADDVKAITPWLRKALTDHPKEDENSDACQVFSLLLRFGHTHNGTAPFSRETCICRG
ncbi:hypothetical protein RVR_4471 [Actinacidiphila reveromycinica]|uniref:Uncharacterized protein n=1 Tax=Actinacidiphila reveromycinica TaxID=659352 RepID=A0A7U3UTE4_9ACTN|nr:hypothetical protein [Streptomyces sp. SN-593]BBA98331.1 hypothetical protein RVR_4471 [Streptomyces sp. SN-593]